MGRLKLKVPKLTWKGKLDKLRTIILAGAAWDEIDPEVVKLFDDMRSAVRGIPSERDWSAKPPDDFGRWMVEPYSDAKGNPELLFGWDVQAAFYGVDGKPWWLLRASNKFDQPSRDSIQNIERAVDYFGAHVERDRIMDCSFGEGHGYSMWWTWINQHPLLETHIRKEPLDMRVVPEGSFVLPGYERIDRARIKRSNERSG
jgi:hypothetical protein